MLTGKKRDRWERGERDLTMAATERKQNTVLEEESEYSSYS